MNRTYSPKKDEVDRHWYVVDAADKPMGRVCTEVARLLTGKHKPQYARHIDTGDFVIVINAARTVLSGQKEQQKVYYRHSMHPGGLKMESAERLRQRQPTRMIERAVRGMLPKNKLGRQQLRKLKVYAGAEHPHEAQQPESVSIA